MEQLINMLVEQTGISEEAAQQAVQVVISYIQERLPGPVADQIDGLLSGADDSQGEDIGGTLKGMLGG